MYRFMQVGEVAKMKLSEKATKATAFQNHNGDGNSKAYEFAGMNGEKKQRYRRNVLKKKRKLGQKLLLKKRKH